MRKVVYVGIVFVLLLVLGHWSGNQPERDARTSAREELGLAFDGSFVDVGEVSLHVVFAGPEDGPPVLLLHGFPEEEMNQYRAAWDREGAIRTMGDWYRAEAWPLEGSGLVRRRSKLKPPGTGNPDRAVSRLLFEGAI
jgi:hypothetical protein